MVITYAQFMYTLEYDKLHYSYIFQLLWCAKIVLLFKHVAVVAVVADKICCIQRTKNNIIFIINIKVFWFLGVSKINCNICNNCNARICESRRFTLSYA